jgi:hypothetical protein
MTFVIQISDREVVGVGGLAVSNERVLSGSGSASRVQGVLVGADGLRSRVGVLVLAGSSGRVDVERARSFAQLGAVALAQRWFGGSGQAKGICEIPLEEFVRGVDLLVEAGASRVVVVGASKGAEGETAAPDRAAVYAYGGSQAADEALGGVAWRAALRLAHLE